jgi:ankyrin repeat protein
MKTGLLREGRRMPTGNRAVECGATRPGTAIEIAIAMSVWLAAAVFCGAVTVGDSRDAVLTEMGKPIGAMRRGGVEILRYTKGEVELRNGRVTATTLPPPTPAQSVPETPAPPSPVDRTNGLPLTVSAPQTDEPDRVAPLPSAIDTQGPSPAPVTPEAPPIRDIFDAARLGDSAALERFLANGADVNAKDEHGFTVLMYAASNGHLDIVKAALAKGSDARAEDENGRPALIDAAKAGHLGIVNALLAAGARLNGKDDYGWTALMEAVRGGRTDVVRALVDRGARVNTSALNGWNPLMDAATKGHTEIVEALLAGGANPNAKEDGETALVEAVRGDHVATVKVLLAAGADVNARSRLGEPVLTMAAGYTSIDMVQVLLAGGADVHAINDDSETALTKVSRQNRPEIVKVLLQAGAGEDPGKEHRRETVRRLLRRLRNADMETRWTVAGVLGDVADPAALKPLMSLMVCLDGDLRQTAAEGIGKIGDLRTAGVLIAYLNADKEDDPYEPLLGLGEMGGARVYRAVKQRVERARSKGDTAYHGKKALEKIEAAGTADMDVSEGAIALWYLGCWIGFLGRWLVIAVVRLRMMTDPSRSKEEQTGRNPLWFERFILILLAALCVIRLLYVLIFDMNPGALRIAWFAGMPLGRYILCAVMDPVVILLTIRAVFRQRRWGWPLLFTYIPTAILLGRYDDGYWTMVMLIAAAWVVFAFGTWALATHVARRHADSVERAGARAVERSRLTKSLLSALVVLNSIRLLFAAGASVVFFRFLMSFGWDALSIALGIIATAVSGILDAAILFLVNKLVLKLIGRSRAGRAWLQGAIDALIGLSLGGLCLYACGFVVYQAANDAGSVARQVVQAGGAVLLIAALSFYPLMQVWRNREQKILRYFVIATVAAYLIAQPLALVWLWTP